MLANDESVSDEPSDEGSAPSLPTDLALACAEIKHLRAERDTLRRNAQRLAAGGPVVA